jgi:UDP-N-acetylmuramoyl-tripeptide--D-alanyl-D-alanine ligase
VRPGGLVVAIRGARVDGHDYARDAAARGAGALLGERRAAGLPAGFPAVIVPGSLDALRSLGVAAKKKMGFRLAAITGSAGKTTTKDFTAAMLARRFAVEKTPGNQNSQIGFPMSVVNLPRAPEWMVGEMGLSEPGDLSTLSRLRARRRGDPARAAAHLQYFASLERSPTARPRSSKD